MLDIFFPERFIELSGLTESASSDASSHDLEHNSVLSYLDIGDNRFGRIKNIRYFQTHLFFDGFGNIIIYRKHGFNSAVFRVFDIIKSRNIDTWHLCTGMKEIFPRSAVCLTFFIIIKDLSVSCLAFTYIEYVKKVRDRLRIVCTRSSAYDNWIIPCSVFCQKRNLRKIQNLQYIRVTHLILQSKTEEIKILDRFLRFQRKKRNVLFSEDFIHIKPR